MVHQPSGWRLAVVATLLSAFVSLGFSIISLISPSLIARGVEAAQVAPFAGYALSRSIVIASATLVGMTTRSVMVLSTVGWIAGGVQAVDALVGMMQGDLVKVLGPAALAAFSAYALVRLARSGSVGLESGRPITAGKNPLENTGKAGRSK